MKSYPYKKLGGRFSHAEGEWGGGGGIALSKAGAGGGGHKKVHLNSRGVERMYNLSIQSTYMCCNEKPCIYRITMEDV